MSLPPPFAVPLITLAMIALTLGCDDRGAVELKPTAPAAKVVKTVAMSVTEVERTTRQPATLHALYTAAVRAKASGFVTELRVDLGDSVNQNDVLAIIDVPELDRSREVIQAQIERHDAVERQAKAKVKLAQAQRTAAQARLVQAQSQVASMEASLAAAQAEFSRTEDLVERQSLQTRMLDEARKKRDSQAAMRDSARAAIESAEASIAVADAEVSATLADVDAAAAETNIARRQLDELDVRINYATLRAPLAGIVTDRNVEPGDLVREASEVGDGQPLFIISQVDQLRVRIPIPEIDAPFVNPGHQVTLTFPAFESEPPVTATISRVAGSLNPSTRSMIAEAIVENPERRLLPGMFGEATIRLDSKVAARMLPARAVRFDEKGQAYVYLVNADQKVAKTAVEVGLDTGNSLEILTELASDDRIIDANLNRFTDGETVTVLAD